MMHRYTFDLVSCSIPKRDLRRTPHVGCHVLVAPQPTSVNCLAASDQPHCPGRELYACCHILAAPIPCKNARAVLYSSSTHDWHKPGTRLRTYAHILLQSRVMPITDTKSFSRSVGASVLNHTRLQFQQPDWADSSSIMRAIRKCSGLVWAPAVALSTIQQHMGACWVHAGDPCGIPYYRSDLQQEWDPDAFAPTLCVT